MRRRTMVLRAFRNAADAPHNSLQRFGTDVVAVKHSLRVQLVDDCVDLVLGGLEVGGGGFDEEDASGGGDEALVAVGDAGVVDVGGVVDGDGGDFGTLDDVDGVAVGGEDDAEGGAVAVPGEAGVPPSRMALMAAPKSLVSLGRTTSVSGSPKRALNSMTLGPSAVAMRPA